MKRTNFRLTKRQEYRNVLQDVVYRYYKDNNLRLSDNWQETLQRYRVYKAFDNIIYDRTDDFCMNKAVQELRKVLPELRKLVRQCDDGSTPYGTESDYGNLCYVSDRWFCEGRLTWLIQLAERNWTYKEVPEKDYPDQTTWEKV